MAAVLEENLNVHSSNSSIEIELFDPDSSLGSKIVKWLEEQNLKLCNKLCQKFFPNKNVRISDQSMQESRASDPAQMDSSLSLLSCMDDFEVVNQSDNNNSCSGPAQAQIKIMTQINEWPPKNSTADIDTSRRILAPPVVDRRTSRTSVCRDPNLAWTPRHFEEPVFTRGRSGTSMAEPTHNTHRVRSSRNVINEESRESFTVNVKQRSAVNVWQSGSSLHVNHRSTVLDRESVNPLGTKSRVVADGSSLRLGCRCEIQEGKSIQLKRAIQLSKEHDLIYPAYCFAICLLTLRNVFCEYGNKGRSLLTSYKFWITVLLSGYVFFFLAFFSCMYKHYLYRY